MSAVIYAAIVVMWAVVLVPMWLRRHDAATESRSVDRFSTAMRTLSRRTSSGPGRRYVVMPRRSQDGVSVHVSGASAADEQPRRTARVASQVSASAGRAVGAATAARRRREQRLSLVARRRRLLLGLLAVTFLTMLLAAVGALSWALQVVVDVILVAFCIHLRGQARQAATVSRQRRRATAATGRPVGRPAARPAPGAATRTAARPAAPVYAPVAESMPAAEEALAATGTEQVGSEQIADPTWEPVPVPRPTYTMKPPVYAGPAYDPLRETDPYGMAGGPVPGAEVIAAEEVAPDGDSDLDDILDRRWAVND